MKVLKQEEEEASASASASASSTALAVARGRAGQLLDRLIPVLARGGPGPGAGSRALSAAWERQLQAGGAQLPGFWIPLGYNLIFLLL